MSEQLKEYNASSMRVLKGLEACRERPGMYIGSTDTRGLHHLIWEVVDNSVDEHLAGHCNKIIVIIRKDGSVSVEDNGRGIPTDMHPSEGKTGVEIALTVLHAGGKFDKNTYKVSGGLHGVGVSVVNALSKLLIIEIKQKGKIFVQEYSYGDPKTELEIVGETDSTGTKVTFYPDEKIFSTTQFDFDIVKSRLREMAFLNPKLEIIITDERTEPAQEEKFFFEGGIIEFARFLNKGRQVLNKDPIYFKVQDQDTIIEVSLQWNDGYTESVFSFVNNINTSEGGTHLTGFSTALTRVINSYLKKKKIVDVSLTGDDVKEGLAGIISLKIPNPQFEGQTKTKLGNSEVKGAVDRLTFDSLTNYFE